MYEQLLKQLGLSKNEAAIYESLLVNGESSVDRIARKSNVYRRNVYDSLHRLIEKGLVFEILESRERKYQAVDPGKLMEFLREKEMILAKAMPELQKLYSSVPHEQEVYIYRGPEGWKNYMRDIIRIGEDFYSLGAKGAWLDKSVQGFFPQFIKEVRAKKIAMHHLFDHEIQNEFPDIVQYVGKEYKFLPKGYSTPAIVDFFGNRTYFKSNIKIGGSKERFAITIIVNQQIADAFRTWFKLMWDLLPEEKNAKSRK